MVPQWIGYAARPADLVGENGTTTHGRVALETATALARTPGASGPRDITILGSTGSIGCSTLDLVSRNPGSYNIIALTAQSNVARLAEQAVKLEAGLAVIGDAELYEDLKSAVSGSPVEAAAGPSALIEAAAHPADWTMAAIMGSAGLEPTLEAVKRGANLALANKECLVTAGEIFMAEVARSGTCLLPVDSEHSAGFQAISSEATDSIEKITLTASGGPFREWPAEKIAKATPEDALRHPTWSMGKKLTIDSATLMNKGLELIEAYYLFPVGTQQLDVVIHPQSIIHCLVEYTDGSVIAQLSEPDMRTPIAYSLSWPQRMWAPTRRLDLATVGTLTFESPDLERFPALRLAREALEAHNGLTTVLNAANEVAVDSFLARRIGLPGIPELVAETMSAAAGEGFVKPQSLNDVLELDRRARDLARRILQGQSGRVSSG